MDGPMGSVFYISQNLFESQVKFVYTINCIHLGGSMGLPVQLHIKAILRE